MGYSREIYRDALERVRQRRVMAERTQRDIYEKIVKTSPDIAKIDSELASAGVKAARAAARGEPVDDIKKYADRLNQAKSGILAGLGVDPACLRPAYECSECSDTGYVHGRLCSCVQRIAKDIAYSRLCSSAPLEQSDFTTFSLAYYPDETREDGVNPGKVMTDNFMFSMEYASAFAPGAKSIMFMGPTGLGKTHLSLAIAKAVLDKGYGVIYGSVQNLLTAVEKEHFGKNTGEDVLNSLLECDLLILDDLGTEFATQFSSSVIYNIINTRILYSHPTIISTNLTFKEIEERYSERILSRIVGAYSIKKFCGEDIRKIKAFG